MKFEVILISKSGGYVQMTVNLNCRTQTFRVDKDNNVERKFWIERIWEPVENPHELIIETAEKYRAND